MKVFTNHLIVCVTEVTEIISNLFFFCFFFSRKDFKLKKSTKRKTSVFYFLRSLCAQKIVAFVVFLFAYFCFISWFFCLDGQVEIGMPVFMDDIAAAGTTDNIRKQKQNCGRMKIE